MSKLTPSFEDEFDEAVDNATHAVIECFEFLPGLPQREVLSGLMIRINDGITALMAEYKGCPQCHMVGKHKMDCTREWVCNECGYRAEDASDVRHHYNWGCD